MLCCFTVLSTHSVHEVNKESFQACNTTNVIQCYSTGNTSFPLTYPGDRYFFCGNRLYCYSGMKLHVLVEQNQTAEARAESGGGGSLPTDPSSKRNNLPPVVGSAIFVHVGLNSILLVLWAFLSWVV